MAQKKAVPKQILILKQMRLAVCGGQKYWYPSTRGTSMLRWLSCIRGSLNLGLSTLFTV